MLLTTYLKLTNNKNGDILFRNNDRIELYNKNALSLFYIWSVIKFNQLRKYNQSQYSRCNDFIS